MILSILSMLVCVATPIFIWLVLSAIQLLCSIPEAFLLVAIILSWLAGLGFLISLMWFRALYDEYKIEKALEKEFKK